MGLIMAGMSAKPETTVLDDDDFLALVEAECRDSIGFDNDDELADNRERALEYAKGEMDDLPALKNRSKAVSTDIADALETIKPDLMEIFTGGDDVATFRPTGEEDEDAAAQETDYVNYVLFEENDGWRIIYSVIHDALLTKIGVTKVWGETFTEEEEESFTGQSEAAVMVATAQAEERDGELRDLVAGDPNPETGESLWNFTLVTRKPKGSCRVMNVAPEDFTVAKDTVILRDTTYCAMRARPRAQELIADGYDRDLIEELPAYGASGSETTAQARDVAGEHSSGVGLLNGSHNLHQVQIIEHYIRVDADGDGTPELWCVVTDSSSRVLLKRNRVDRIPFSVSTPFIVTHRLYGLSLADKLFEVQRIKTMLLRMWLDSGYFALNQRHEVAMDRANEFTLPDLLSNTPGTPVRSKTGDATRALGGAGLGFDVLGGLEFMSTVAEGRTGIARNAQGLNPDTLHDTARGAQALMSAAMKRTRMIARVFAETGIKDMLLLIHAVTRTMPPPGGKTRLRNKWVEIDPTSFGARNDMKVEIGIGSGSRETELAALNMVMDTQEKLVTLQGGEANGPYVTKENIFATTKRLVELAGLRNAVRYFSDPTSAEPMQDGPPPVDPALAKVNGELELKRYEIDQETAIKREQMEAEFQLRKEQMLLEAKLAAIGGAGGVGGAVQFGGEVG